jgi:hypothetical protein
MEPVSARKLLARPQFKDAIIIRPDDVDSPGILGIELTRKVITFDKPMFVGLAVLDISKTLIYDYHYNVIKAKYGDKARLCMTDTDSLVYHIETEDIFRDLCSTPEDLRHYDTSAYPPDHPSGLDFRWGDRSGKKVPGLFKDEMNGAIMREFVGLRPKMYAKTTMAGHTTRKAKGIAGAVVKHNPNLKLENYRECLYSGTSKHVEIPAFASKNHEVTTVLRIKQGLCSFEDKRYWLEGGLTSLAYGHYSIESTPGDEVKDDVKTDA